MTSGSSVVNYTAIDTSYDAAFWKSRKSPLVIEEMTVTIYHLLTAIKK